MSNFHFSTTNIVSAAFFLAYCIKSDLEIANFALGDATCYVWGKQERRANNTRRNDGSISGDVPVAVIDYAKPPAFLAS
jgi:hypothetical protein